jgi:hypothetical protein
MVATSIALRELEDDEAHFAISSPIVGPRQTRSTLVGLPYDYSAPSTAIAETFPFSTPSLAADTPLLESASPTFDVLGLYDEDEETSEAVTPEDETRSRFRTETMSSSFTLSSYGRPSWPTVPPRPALTLDRAARALSACSCPVQ